MKILAIDDDPIILQLLEQFMSAIGDHDLQTMVSGAEAYKTLQTHPEAYFDCFLIDVQMPGMDGIELIGKIRTIECYRETPALMLTAMSEKRYVDAAFAAGATDYVTKPFEVTELKTRLGLAEKLANSNRTSTKKIFAVQNLQGVPQPANGPQKFEVYEPITIFDVDNVIELVALENYVSQLSRGSLFGSTCFAFSIRKVQEYYDEMSAFEFSALIEDVAETISDALAGHQFLMSYAGNGVFVCVSESGWLPDMKKLQDRLNLQLAVSEFYNNRGERICPRVAGGEATRMLWKSGGSLLETLANAHASAERAAIARERELKELFTATAQTGTA